MLMSDPHQTIRREAVRSASRYFDAMLADPFGYRGQQLRGTGPVADFESLLAERCGFPFCVATCNATSALLVVALAAGLPGRQIVVPPKAWSGSIGPFEFAGAKLVVAEGDPHGNLDPASVRRLVARDTAAVLAVDWNGHRHHYEAIRRICDEKECLYIEDTAWIPGISTRSMEPSFADIQILSFGPGKPLPLGEGGAILLRSGAFYNQVIALSQHPERAIAKGIVPISDRIFLNARIHPAAALIGASLLRRASQLPAQVEPA